MLEYKPLGVVYRRLVHKYFLNDLMFDLRLRAKQEAVEFILPHLKTAMLFDDRYDQLASGLERARKTHPNGLVCEFGVAGGKTIKRIAKRWQGYVHGFDTFSGLPEDWTGTTALAGAFRQKRMPNVPSNVTLHAGLFNDTVPPFLAANPGPAALLHLDADLYSSTKTVLTLFKDRIVPGTVLVFDEYCNYPNWREHEHKALGEFIAETGKAHRFIGFSTTQGQASVLID